MRQRGGRASVLRERRAHTWHAGGERAGSRPRHTECACPSSSRHALPGTRATNLSLRYSLTNIKLTLTINTVHGSKYCTSASSGFVFTHQRAAETKLYEAEQADVIFITGYCNNDHFFLPTFTFSIMRDSYLGGRFCN